MACFLSTCGERRGPERRRAGCGLALELLSSGDGTESCEQALQRHAQRGA